MKLYWCEDKNHSDWDLWDDFLQETPRGHYLQLSDWLKGYSVYGFDASLGLIKDDIGRILGGIGVVKAKFSFIKLFVVPAGPIIREGYEDLLELFIQEFYDYSKNNGATYAHINLPMLEQCNMPFALPLSSLKNDSIFFTGNVGIKFKHVSSITGLRWIDFEMLNNYEKKEENLFNSLPYKAKRKIKSCIKNNVICKISENFEDFFKSYKIIEKLSKNNGYIVREWDDMKSIFYNLSKKNFVKFINAEHQNEIKGSIWVVKCGQRYTYMSGASKRENSDISVGYLMQWFAIVNSLNEGMIGYDISVGGNQGVINFKNSFSPVYYSFIPPRYWIFKPGQFYIFYLIYKNSTKYKKIIAKILRNIKRY